MSATVKAIETVYQGYRFRSRLEARWAVFFDALGVAWEYEKEGFDLGPAGWYLPDFWLPLAGLWAEVKPGPPGDAERERAEALVRATGRPCALLVGAPALREYEIRELQQEGWGYDPERRDALGFMEPLRVVYDAPRVEGAAIAFTTRWLADEHRFGYFMGWPAGDEDAWPEDIVAAVYAARSARFEHGESGAALRAPARPATPPQAAREPLVVVPAAPARRPPAPGITLEAALARLPEVVEAVGRESLPVAALLRGGTPVGVEPGNALVLEFPSDFHRTRLQEAPNRVAVEKALRRVLGTAVRLRCVPAPWRPGVGGAEKGDVRE